MMLVYLCLRYSFYMIAKFPTIKNSSKSPTKQIWYFCHIDCNLDFNRNDNGQRPLLTLIKDLPVIKSTHVNVRYAGALVLLFSILFAFCYSKLLVHRSLGFKIWCTISVLFITFLSMSNYSKITYSKTAYHSFDASISSSTWSDLLSENKSFKLSEIIEISPKDQVSLFSQGASSLNPNDCLYGYHGEFFQSALSTGPVNEVDEDGFYNFHNPLTFYSPKTTSLPREKIHSSDSKKNTKRDAKVILFAAF